MPDASSYSDAPTLRAVFVERRSTDGGAESVMAFHHDHEVNRLTGKIIGAAITVHRHLGPGLLESSYEACLAEELRLAGLTVRRQVEAPLEYRGLRLRCGYRIDILVEETVIVELKVVAKLDKVHVAQVLTYLRLADLNVGLLFNFNVEALAAGGIKRVLRS